MYVLMVVFWMSVCSGTADDYPICSSDESPLAEIDEEVVESDYEDEFSSPPKETKPGFGGSAALDREEDVREKDHDHDRDRDSILSPEKSPARSDADYGDDFEDVPAELESDNDNDDRKESKDDDDDNDAKPSAAAGGAGGWASTSTTRPPGPSAVSEKSAAGLPPKKPQMNDDIEDDFEAESVEDDISYGKV